MNSVASVLDSTKSKLKLTREAAMKGARDFVKKVGVSKELAILIDEVWTNVYYLESSSPPA